MSGDSLSSAQGYLDHKKPRPLLDPSCTVGICLGTYGSRTCRTITKDLRWPSGRMRFLVSEVTLYMQCSVRPLSKSGYLAQDPACRGTSLITPPPPPPPLGSPNMLTMFFRQERSVSEEKTLLISKGATDHFLEDPLLMSGPPLTVSWLYSTRAPKAPNLKRTANFEKVNLEPRFSVNYLGFLALDNVQLH